METQRTLATQRIKAGYFSVASAISALNILRVNMKFIITVVFAFLLSTQGMGQELPSGKPDASIDLATNEGTQLIGGEWRYSDTKIVETQFNAAGPDGQPSGPSVKTYDYAPHAGAIDFDDSGWEKIAATDLVKRRGNGRLSFNWYRVTITVPQKIGDLDPTGSTIVFETALDDYAEIWVDGEISRYLGQQGGSVVAGWNAPNRLVIGRDVKPGQKIQLAIFGINGPISNPPTNFIWVREAKLDFYKNAPAGPVAITPSEVNVEVIRNDEAINKIVG